MNVPTPENTSKSYWIVSSNRWNSAVTEYALSSAKALQSAGFNVTFTPLSGSPAQARALQANLRVKPLASFSFKDLPQFISLSRQVRADTILLMSGPETFLAKAVSGKRFRVWAEASRDPALIGTWKGRCSFSHLNGFIAPATHLVEAIRPHTAKPVHHIQLGTDAAIFQRQETMGRFLQKRPQIVILGRFDPVKGHERALDLLARAFERWRDKERRPCLHIIGEPANISQQQMERLVTERGLTLGDDVILSAKRVGQIDQVLSQAILGLIPSLGSELICRVGQEFLMCGTPVVVSGVGSLEEILFDESAGASYANMSCDDDITTLIMNWVDQSMTEGELAKRKRSLRAREIFGLAAMADKLNKISG